MSKSIRMSRSSWKRKKNEKSLFTHLILCCFSRSIVSFSSFFVPVRPCQLFQVSFFILPRSDSLRDFILLLLRLLGTKTYIWKGKRKGNLLLIPEVETLVCSCVENREGEGAGKIILVDDNLDIFPSSSQVFYSSCKI